MTILEQLKNYSAEGFCIPDYMHEGLAKYIEDHKPSGSFLMAVLSNDLVGTLQSADGINKRNLLAYIYFLMEFAPPQCWGSQAKVKAWIKND